MISSYNKQSLKETVTLLTCPHQFFYVPEIFTFERYRGRRLSYFQWIYFSITTDVTSLQKRTSSQSQEAKQFYDVPYDLLGNPMVTCRGRGGLLGFLHCVDLATLLVMTYKLRSIQMLLT